MQTHENQNEFRCGMVAVLGLPNAGKSTLLNGIVGETLAIASPKPQTTRNQLRGILMRPHAQIIFVDTPGIGTPLKRRTAREFQDYLTEEALSALDGVDLVVFVLDAEAGLTEEAEALWKRVAEKAEAPLILVLNKIDLLKPRQTKLLPLIEESAARLGAETIFPISAQTKDGLEEFLQFLESKIPSGPALYPEDQRSDRNDRFLAAEIIREQVFHRMHEEIPYSTAVEIHAFQESEDLIEIVGDIYVERESQKGMVVGKGGQMIKQIGTAARKKMQSLFGVRIDLRLHVKVLENWAQDPKHLKQLGYVGASRKKS